VPFSGLWHGFIPPTAMFVRCLKNLGRKKEGKIRGHFCSPSFSEEIPALLCGGDADFSVSSSISGFTVPNGCWRNKSLPFPDSRPQQS